MSARDRLDDIKAQWGLKTDIELAKKLEVSKITLDKWLVRDKIPDKIELKIRLLSQNTASDGYSEKERQIIDSFRKLPLERQDMYFHRILGDALEYETMTNPLGGNLSGSGVSKQKTS